MRERWTRPYGRSGAWALAMLACLSGPACMSSKVHNGAVIGALSGAAAGAGVGVLITDENLLGSSASPETGDTSLPRGGGIAASLAIGAVVGAIVGSMVGHQQEHGYERPAPVSLPPPAYDESEEGEASEQSAVGAPARL